MKRWVLGFVVFFCSSLILFAGGTGEKVSYPQKPIEIVVPYGAGGGQDVFTRITAKYMVKYLPPNSKVVVNNVTGGGGVVGATAIATQKPDGYQLGSIVPFQLTDQFIVKGVTYTEKNFVILGVGSSDAHFLVAKLPLGVKTMQDLIALMKSKPGEITMALGGSWNSHDFFRMKLEKAAGIQFKRLPVAQGGAAALALVVGGNADTSSQSISEALAAIEAKQVVPLGVSQEERTPLAPNVPTFKEMGINCVHAQWRAITCPPGTPQEIQDTLIKVLDRTFSDPGWIEESKKAGLNPINLTGQKAREYVAADFEVYKSLIKEFNLKPMD